VGSQSSVVLSQLRHADLGLISRAWRVARELCNDIPSTPAAENLGHGSLARRKSYRYSDTGTMSHVFYRNVVVGVDLRHGRKASRSSLRSQLPDAVLLSPQRVIAQADTAGGKRGFRQLGYPNPPFERWRIARR
jgi:hypothetical protein